MNLQLLKKEVGGLALVIWLIVAIWCINWCYLLSTGFPDRKIETGEELADAIADMLLFGILIGISLFGQERENQTMSFLDGLPLRRSNLLFHKFIAACGVIGFVVFLQIFFGAVYFLFSRDSLSPPFSIGRSLAEGSASFLIGYTIVGVSAFLSFSRKWFPLVAGLVLWGIIWIRSSDSWLSGWLDTAELLKTMSTEGSLYVAWKPMIGHFVLGSLGWVCSTIAFHYRDGWLSQRIDRMSNWRLAAWFVALGQLAAALVWMAAMSSILPNSEDRDIESRAAGVVLETKNANAQNELTGFGVYRTDYYEVIFRESQRLDVDRVFWSLDNIHEEVRKFFGNPAAPRSKIVLDTASPVMSHASGQANWTKIRVPLVLAEDDMDFLRTVRHETAHVYIEQLSGGRARDHFNAMRMFHEGVASLVEYGGNDELDLVHRLAMERWAWGVDTRGRVPFQVLCDNEKLVALRDPNIVYPLGFVVAQSLVDTGGPALPRRFLETLQNTPLPPGVRPAELWRIVLQQCGTSLDFVVANYESRLDALDVRERDFLAVLPKLTAEVTVEGGDVVIRVSPPKSERSGATILCEIERDRFFTKLPEPIAMNEEGEFRVPRSTVTGNRIRILVGWRTPDSDGAIYEPWIEKTLE